MTPTSTPRASLFSTLLLPAIIAQSMIMGGGYATGREIMEYAGKFGPDGWITVVGILLGFSILCMIGFELARVGQAYDYKNFIRLLIGPLWPLFDLVLFVFFMLVMAVMMSAIGSILRQTVGVPTWLSIAIAVGVVAFVAFRGSATLERFKTIGSVGLYIAWIAFSILVLTGPLPEAPVPSELAVVEPTRAQVLRSALEYVGYNMTILPPVLFCLYRQKHRSETLLSGALAGVAMTVPFALTMACIVRFWPDGTVVDAEVPWLPMLQTASEGRGGTALWIALFGVVAGWTLVETAVGGIHALVDRIEHNLDDLPRFLQPASGELEPWHRSSVGVGLLLLAMALSAFGIIDLVAVGYRYLAWGFLALLVFPLIVIAPWQIARLSREP